MLCSMCDKKQPYLHMEVVLSNDDFCTTSCKLRCFEEYLPVILKNKFFIEKQREKCNFCSGYFNNLNNLSCGHSLCEKCLVLIFEEKMNCPCCQGLTIAVNNIGQLSQLHGEIVNKNWRMISHIRQSCDPDILQDSYMNRNGRDVKKDIENILEYYNYLIDFL